MRSLPAGLIGFSGWDWGSREFTNPLRTSSACITTCAGLACQAMGRVEASVLRDL
jgi:hypothetical protein